MRTKASPSTTASRQAATLAKYFHWVATRRAIDQGAAESVPRPGRIDQLGNVGPPFIDRQVALEFGLRQLGTPCLNSRLRLGKQFPHICQCCFALFPCRPLQFALQTKQSARITGKGATGCFITPRTSVLGE